MTHQISSCPLPIQAQVASFLSHRDLGVFAQLSRGAKAAAAVARRSYHYPAIRAWTPNTFIGRLVNQHPLVDNGEGRIEWVQRVHQTAAAYIQANRHRMEEEDLQALGISSDTRVGDLSYKQLNDAASMIADRRLLKIMADVVTDMNLRAASLAIRLSCHDKAEKLRRWLANIPRNMTESADVGKYLHTAAEEGDFEVVQLILSCEGSIDSSWLGITLSDAVRREGFGEITRAILESKYRGVPREIDSVFLYIALRVAEDNGDQATAQAIRDSGRPPALPGHLSFRVSLASSRKPEI